MFDVDRAVEAYTDRLIEKVFGGDDIPNWYPARSEIDKAYGLLIKAADALATAGDYLAGTDEEDRITELIEAVEETNDRIFKQLDKMGGGIT